MYIYIYVYGHLQLTKSGENTKLRTSTVLDEIDGLVGSWEPAEIQMGSQRDTQRVRCMLQRFAKFYFMIYRWFM